MRALVTGATGFLGSALARRLVADGHEVRILARSTSDRSRLAGIDVDAVVGDVTDPGAVGRALADVDVVFHAAAYVEMGARDPSAMERVNVDGTAIVLQAAADRDVLAIHVSSVAALGPTGPDEVDESWWNPAEPVVAYERTKRAAHELALDLVDDGARIRIGIPGGIYGAGDTTSMGQLITAFVSYPTPVGYLPEVVKALVNVDDCADGLVRIATSGVDGEQYLLCADAVPIRRWFECIALGAGRRPPSLYLSTRTLRRSARPAARLASLVGANPTLVVDTIEMAACHQAFSGDRARKELEWDPRSLETGMAEMATAIRAERSGRRRR